MFWFSGLELWLGMFASLQNLNISLFATIAKLVFEFNLNPYLFNFEYQMLQRSLTFYVKSPWEG